MEHSEICIRYRKMKEMKQTELAEFLDIEQGTVSKIELSKARFTATNLWQIIEEVLDLNLSVELNKKFPKATQRKKSSRLLKKTRR